MKDTLKNLAHSIRRPRDARERLYHLLLTEQENVYNISYAYESLATLLSAGYFSTIVMTNTDTLLEQALDGLRPVPPPYQVIIFGRDPDERVAMALDGQEKGICIIKLPNDENIQFVDDLYDSLRGYLQRNILVVGSINGLHHDIIQALTENKDTNTLYYIIPDKRVSDVLLDCMQKRYKRYDKFLIEGPDGEFVTFFRGLALLLPYNNSPFIRYNITSDNKSVRPLERERKSLLLDNERFNPFSTKEQVELQANETNPLLGVQQVNAEEMIQPASVKNQFSLEQQESKTRPLPNLSQIDSEELVSIEDQFNFPWRPGIEPEPSEDQTIKSGPLELGSPQYNAKNAIHQLPWTSGVDLLIITVTNVELKSFLDLYPQRVRRPVRGKTYYDLGYVGHARTVVVQANNMGPIEALTTTDEGIRVLSPQAVIMVGIAFGLRPEEQRIGDVLVSMLVHDYDLERVGTGVNDQLFSYLRGTRVKASDWLIDRFHAGSHEWSLPPAIHFGSILSGSKLIDNKDYQEALLRSAPDAIGGEMEGVGFSTSAIRNKVDWLLVKGISDWADGTKEVNKAENRRLAAENAAKFVLFVIGQEDFMRRL